MSAQEEATTDLGRVNAFSDGLFAIAATLLALSIRIPDVPSSELPEHLDDLIEPTLIYFLSFSIVGIYWLRHHELLRHMSAATPRFLRLNLAFLSLVALVPVPNELLARYGDLTAPTVIYSAFMIVLSGSLRLLALEVQRSGVLTGDPEFTHSRRGNVIIVMFAVSIPIALWNPDVAKYAWLATAVAANAVARARSVRGAA